jgi:hypothetical protein
MTGSKSFDKTTVTEPLSSIFGIFTIMDKDLFYKEKALNFNHFHLAGDLHRVFIIDILTL